MKGNLEIPITVTGSLVSRFATRIMGAWHEATIRMEVAYARKAVDIIDLQEQRVRDHFPDARYSYQLLGIWRSEYAIAQFSIEAVNLRLEDLVFPVLEPRVQARQFAGTATLYFSSVAPMARWHRRLRLTSSKRARGRSRTSRVPSRRRASGINRTRGNWFIVAASTASVFTFASLMAFT